MAAYGNSPKNNNNSIINVAGLCLVGGNMGGAGSPHQTRRYSCCAVPGPRQAQATEYFSHHRVTISLSTRFSRRPDPLMMGRVPWSPVSWDCLFCHYAINCDRRLEFSNYTYAIFREFKTQEFMKTVLLSHTQYLENLRHKNLLRH